VSHTLVQEYRKLINKHHAAVMADAKLEYTDSWKAEKLCQRFWDEFRGFESRFVAMLEAVDEDQMDKSV
jgi:hypothetical protein